MFNIFHPRTLVLHLLVRRLRSSPLYCIAGELYPRGEIIFCYDKHPFVIIWILIYVTLPLIMMSIEHQLRCCDINLPGHLVLQLDGCFVFSIFSKVVSEKFMGLRSTRITESKSGSHLSWKLRNLKRRIISQGGNLFREKEKLAGISLLKTRIRKRKKEGSWRIKCRKM